MTSEGFSLSDIIAKRDVAPGVFTAEFLKSVTVVSMDAPFAVSASLHFPALLFSLGAASEAGDLTRPSPSDENFGDHLLWAWLLFSNGHYKIQCSPLIFFGLFEMMVYQYTVLEIKMIK